MKMQNSSLFLIRDMDLRVYVNFKGDPRIYVANILLNVLPIVCGSSFLSLFCYVLLRVHSSFAFVLKRKRKPVCYAIIVLQM